MDGAFTYISNIDGSWGIGADYRVGREGADSAVPFATGDARDGAWRSSS